MLRKVILLSVMIFFAVSVSGCATSRKKNDLQMQGLRNQILALETQLQTKDAEIESLKNNFNQPSEEKKGLGSKALKKKVIGEVKSRPKVKEIQIALQNASYNPGAIDGRMGRQTREAIRAFQRANNLVADGRVGRQTWNLLKEYLYKKIK
jgi:peptidoglycan hydrolase-like protein with peptidoglycan-binding domain